MVISCCDSRVHVTSIFGAERGEFFIHRSIADLIPPFETDGTNHGTSAAIEDAVTALGVAHLIVLRHSRCGGVQECHDMCAGDAPALADGSSFVGGWMEILRPAYADLPEGDRATRLLALGHAAVRTSLDNLMSFPFVKEAVDAGTLSLHGLWTDIAEGSLHALHPSDGVFRPL